MFTKQLMIRAPRRGLHMVTDEVAQAVRESGVDTGICNVFIRHTSASLTINENADPTAREDLEVFLDHIAPENEPYYRHTLEGPDDMPSHIKSSLTDSSVNIPVLEGELALGTWQGLYLCEHREQPSARSIIVSVF